MGTKYHTSMFLTTSNLDVIGALFDRLGTFTMDLPTHVVQNSRVVERKETGGRLGKLQVQTLSRT